MKKKREKGAAAEELTEEAIKQSLDADVKQFYGNLEDEDDSAEDDKETGESNDNTNEESSLDTPAEASPKENAEKFIDAESALFARLNDSDHEEEPIFEGDLDVSDDGLFEAEDDDDFTDDDNMEDEEGLNENQAKRIRQKNLFASAEEFEDILTAKGAGRKRKKKKKF